MSETFHNTHSYGTDPDFTGLTLSWEKNSLIDMPPPPPAAIQQADMGSWERALTPAWPGLSPEGEAFKRESAKSQGEGPLPEENLALVDVAALAFDAGWRGEELVEAVAVQIAEERNQNRFAIGDTNIESDTYGPSFGLWQIRSLRQPWQAGQPQEDRLRTFEATSDGFDLLDAQTNAEVAFQLWKARGWQPWSVTHESARGTNNYYMNYIDQAREAVAGLNRILGRAE